MKFFSIHKETNKTKKEEVDTWERSTNKKRFVRYKEGGAKMYSMCQSNFEKLAKEAGATYKVGKLVLVNCDILEQHLECYRIRE